MRTFTTKISKVVLTGIILSTFSIPTFAAPSTMNQGLSPSRVGCIDLSYVLDNSTQAIALKEKEAALNIELQKFGIDAKEKMITSKSTTNKESLEKELISQITLKKETLEGQYKQEIINVQNKIQQAIATVEKDKQLDLVFSKSSLVRGGVDISKDVVNILNSSK